MIKFFKCLFLILLVVLAFSFSCSAVGSSSASNMGMNDYIETSDFYLYVPANQIDNIRFNKDSILYFATTSTVSCLLIYKSSQTLYTCSFPSIYRANSQTVVYNNLLQYYNTAVSVSTNNVSNQRIQPITFESIVNSDINFNNNISDLLDGLILIFIVVGDILSVFLIFSNKRRVSA